MSGKGPYQTRAEYRWFRIWEYFLAYSTIISRQGGASCYQIVLHKVYPIIYLSNNNRISMHSIALTAFPRSTVLKFLNWAEQAGPKASQNISDSYEVLRYEEFDDGPF